MPALPSCAESAIVKHPACAAAISSSGFVPAPSSKRVENEYCVFESTPLAVEMVPLPLLRFPCHSADAFRCIIPPGIDGSRPLPLVLSILAKNRFQLIGDLADGRVTARRIQNQ